MDVSIVIVNYRTVDLIVNCVRSILDNTKDVDYEIIVVDNNSNDNCLDVLNGEFQNIKVILLDDNYGFGVANNEGYKIAKGRNILFLNPDTILLNNAVNILSCYLDNHKDVGICGGNLYDYRLKPTHSFRRLFPSIEWELNGLFHDLISKAKWGCNREFNYTNREIDVAYIVGADLMISSKLFNDSGQFSSSFFMYYEETELSFRVKKMGYRIVSVPEAKIQHLEGKSFSGINVKKIKYQEFGHRTFYKLCYSSYLYRMIACSLYLVTMISRIPFFIVKNKEKALLCLIKIKCFIKYK